MMLIAAFSCRAHMWFGNEAGLLFDDNVIMLCIDYPAPKSLVFKTT